MTSDDIDPETRKALDERIEWINQVTDLCLKHGADAIQKHIDEIEDQHLRSMIFVLVLARARNLEERAQLLREWDERKRQYETTERQFRDHVRRDTMEKLETPPDLAAAQQEIRELQEHVKEQEQLITALRQIGLN